MKYEQENNRTYAVIENEYETQDCEYEQKMLQKNTIAGLLKMQTRRINNKIMFFYDVTSRQTFDKIFSYKNLGWQDFVNVINGIENMARSVDDYMLGIDSVIISPETIFYDAAGTNIEFIYFLTELILFISLIAANWFLYSCINSLSLSIISSKVLK